MPNVQNFGFTTREYRQKDATKEKLREIFQGVTERPSVLFTASHGLEFHPVDTVEIKQRQRQEQGALVCQNWPGFGSIAPDHYFQATDVPDNAQLRGLITFHFACFGGGTPSTNRFLKFSPGEEAKLADKPFFAALPKTLLSHPRGGVLACIAHIERAWGCSFIHPRAGVQLLPFANAIGRILAGQPIGHAVDDFNRRYINLSAVLTSKLEDLLNTPVSDEELAQNWLERNDAESYVVLGDPAAKLRLDLLT